MSWLEGWDYRKSVTLSRPSGAVTNYQMKIMVGESSGSAGCDVHCAGHVASDFDDLRFTTDDGQTLMDYYVHEITGTTPNQTAEIWVEFTSIGTSATTFYMYFGNGAASAASNGSNTFPFLFSDFNGADSSSVWPWSENTNCFSISGNRLKIERTTGSGTTWVSKACSHTGSILFEAKMKTTDQDAYPFWFGITTDTNFYQFMIGLGVDHIHYWDSSGSNSAELYTVADDTYYVVGIRFNSADGKGDYYLNGEQIASGLDPYYATPHASNLAFFEFTVTTMNSGYVDWVRGRKFETTEPSWGSWGSEESEPIELSGDVAIDFAEFTLASDFIGGQIEFAEFEVASTAWVDSAQCLIDYPDHTVAGYGAFAGAVDFPAAVVTSTGAETAPKPDTENVAIDFPEFYVNAGPRHYGNGAMVVDEHDWMEVSAQGGALAAITFPSVVVASEGYRVLTGNGEITYDEMTVASQGGAQAAIEFPDSEINVTGTHELLGTVAINMPEGAISATGKAGNAGTVALAFPAAIVEATGYRPSTGVVAIDFPDLVLNASGLEGPHGDADIAFPSATIVSSGALRSEADAAIAFEFDVIAFGSGEGVNTILRFERYRSL